MSDTTRTRITASGIVLALACVALAQDPEPERSGLHVRVTTCAGELLPDAVVEVRAFDVTAWARRSATPLAVPPARIGTPNEEGTVAFDGLAPGAWHVRAHAQGRAARMRVLRLSEGGVREIALDLPEGRTVAGTVVGNDGPVAGAIVLAGPVGFEGDGDAVLARAVADDSGAYRLDGLPPGPIDIWTQGPDRKPGWSMRLDPRGFDVIELGYADGGDAARVAPDPETEMRTLRGVIRSPDGSPVDGALVGGDLAGAWELTGEDGRYEIALSTRTPRLHARAAGFSSTSVPLGTPSDVDVTLSPSPIARFRVVDEDGDAVAGAQLVLGHVDRYQQRASLRSSSGPEVPAAAYSDGAGRAELHYAPTTFAIPLTVTAPGFGRHEASVHHGDAERIITLQRERVIRVRVRGEDDAPIADAWLRLEPSGDPEVPTISAVPASSQRGPVWVGQTDENGAAVVRGLASGSVRVVAAAHGHHTDGADVDLSASDEPEATVFLPAHRRLEGTFVWEDGTPVARAGYLVHWVDHPPGWPCYFGPWGADTEGRFRIGGLRPGRHEIHLERWGPASYSPKVYGPFEGSETGLRLVVLRPRDVSGRVTRADGSPVAGAQVMLSAGRKFNTGMSSKTETDAAGEFTATAVPHGVVHIRMIHDAWGDHGQARRVETWTPRDPGKARLELVVPEGLSISGRVVDDEGRPRAKLPVVALPVGVTITWDPLNAARTDDDGRFVIEGLEAGRYRLWESEEWPSGGGGYSGPYREPKPLDADPGTDAGATGVKCVWRW